MAQFEGLVGELLEETWRHDPVGATRVGVHRFDHLLADNSQEAMDGWEQKLKDFKGRFDAVNADTLTRTEQLDRRWALAVLDRALLVHGLRNWERSPRNYLSGLGGGLNDLLIGEFAPAEERMEALVSRLKAIPAFLDTARRNLNPKAIPPIWVDYAVQTGQGARRFILDAVPQAAAQQAPALQSEVGQACRMAAQAIADFEGFVRGLGDQAQGAFALGRERFDHILKNFHMLDMDSDDLYESGREWIERYEQEMSDVARQIDADRSWVEVLESIKDDHPEAGQLLRAYDDETALARRHCQENDLITFPAGESCVLEWMPAFLTNINPIALPRVSPPFEEGLASKWYVTPFDHEAPRERQSQHLRDNSWAWIRGIAMHEIYPGHHLNLVIAKQVATPLRLQFRSPYFTEGWGLYTEELFYETGLLADPALRLMQLRNGLWRAVRIVVDTGIHTRDMPTHEAARWLVERARLEPRWAENETRLYTTMPTRVSSYRVGLSMVMDLRERYRAMKGSEFSLKDFHDTFMSYSSLPPKMVQEEMLVPAG